MKLLKIEMHSDEAITITYSAHEKGADVKVRHKSHFGDGKATSVLPALIACYKKFSTFIPDLTVPGFEEVTATAINFKENKTGCRGIVISGKATVEDNSRPWNFNTPVKFESKKEPGKANTLSLPIIEAIDEIEKLAYKHINSRPAQSDIFEDDIDDTTADDDKPQTNSQKKVYVGNEAIQHVKDLKAQAEQKEKAAKKKTEKKKGAPEHAK